MGIHDERAQRLYVDAPLAEGGTVACTTEQAHYLRNVMRVPADAAVLVFNGRDGEWSAHLRHRGKRDAGLDLETQTRPQIDGPDLIYLFAPLKRTRLDYMVQKATELGVARLAPVLTRRTIADRVNLERMHANAVEAAEQCGVLRVPAVDPPCDLDKALATWDAARRLIFCDEDAPTGSPIATLMALPAGPLAVLIGPEGGFAPEERERLLAQTFVTPISLGPRIMRADTAAVAALALVNATRGDWR